MLVIGEMRVRREWRRAGMWMDLIPLDDDMHHRFVEQSTEEVRDEQGRLIDIRRNPTLYAQLVGRHCIKAWGGDVVDADGNFQPCRPDTIDLLMLIGEAQEWVIKEVRGLDIRLREKVDEGKDA